MPSGKTSPLVPQGIAKDYNTPMNEEDDFENDSMSDSLEDEEVGGGEENCNKNKITIAKNFDVKEILATNVLCNENVNKMIKI